MKKINKFENNPNQWYKDIITQSEIVSNALVKGTLFFKPYGWAIWKRIQKILTEEFNKLGVEEVQFPSLIPMEHLKKEKSFLKHFSAEVLTITKVGDKQLKSEYFIRPTSELLFGQYFKENLQTYSQLPLKLNQWSNIVRWEKNTKPLLRNTEFYWQEGHTLHINSEEASKFTEKIAQLYSCFFRNSLNLYHFSGVKTKMERFAGAEESHTIEVLLKDGQFLQSGTSHYLADNFAKIFNLKVQGKDNKSFVPFQTSWGISTRVLGAVVATHSDNNGIVLPSKIAPYQIVIIPLLGENSNYDSEVKEYSERVGKQLKNFKFRVKIDYSGKSYGFMLNNWEAKGVPIRIIIGNNERQTEEINLTTRINLRKHTYNRSSLKLENVSKLLISDILKEYDDTLYFRSLDNTKLKLERAYSIEEIGKIIGRGNYAEVHWVENKEDEINLKAKFGATIRCLYNIKNSKSELFSSVNNRGKTTTLAVIGRAY